MASRPPCGPTRSLRSHGPGAQGVNPTARALPEQPGLLGPGSTVARRQRRRADALLDLDLRFSRGAHKAGAATMRSGTIHGKSFP